MNFLKHEGGNDQRIYLTCFYRLQILATVSSVVVLLVLPRFGGLLVVWTSSKYYLQYPSFCM